MALDLIIEQENNMKRRFFWIVLVALLVMVPSMALAANPHFVKTSGSVNNEGALVVSFKEAGLGGGQTIAYEVVANATAVWGCVNKGGNHPKASNKETVGSLLNGTGSFTAGKNGQITGSITVGPVPVPADFSCPGQMKIVLVSVAYTGIVLTDTNTPVSVNIPDASQVLYQY